MFPSVRYRGPRALLAPAAVLLLALCLLAVGAEADPLPGGTPITNNTVITAPGSYYLAQSLADLASPVAISVRSSDVAIDGRSHTVDGQDIAGSTGLEIQPPDGSPAITNVTVTDLRLADWATGLDAAAGIRLVNVTAESGGTGFRLWGPGAATLEGCTAADNAANGIRADGVAGDLALALSDVLVRTSGETGIDARLAAVTMTDCNILENGAAPADGDGFRIYKGSATVRDSAFRSNGGSGIFFDTATSGTVTGSLIGPNGYAGIRDAETAGEGGSLSIYNNQIVNDRNAALGGRVSTWSVPKTAGPNTVGGPSIGGNFWGTLNHTGFSETHPDANGDGFCDEPYVIANGSTDALPLVLPTDTPRPTPAPYTPHAVTDRIQAEDYDVGGENVAYHDTTPGNEGGAYRHDDVDIETGNGITDVGWVRNGEWMTYTVTVPETGSYAVAARVATPNTGCWIAFTVDNAPGTVLSLPTTGSYETYATATRVYYTERPHYPLEATVTMTPPPQGTGAPSSELPLWLEAGTHVLTLEFHGDGQNLDWFELSPFVEPTTPPTPTVAPYRDVALPGTIQAEDYDLGGEGLAYHDTEAANLGGAYRPAEGVDIETGNGITNVGWIRNGEWMTYTVNVTTAGTYTMTARMASPNTGRSMALIVDKSYLASIAVPNTGSFATFRTVDVPVTLSPGWHTIKLSFAGDGQNIDWISFAAPIPTPEPYRNITLPATIQAEDYDLGGEGVAYHDTTPGNSGGACRADDVDVATIPGGNAVVGIEDGEWLNYTISGVEPEGNGLAGLVLFLGSDRDGGRVQIELDGRVVGNVSVPNTGSPTAFTAVQTQVVPTKGTLRLLFLGGGMGMDRIVSQRETLHPEEFPHPNFTADRTDGTAPLTVRFTDTSSEFAYDWRWTFGDGATSTEQNPVHTFLSPGVYPVNLTIREHDHWVYTDWGPVKVHYWDPPIPAYSTKTVNVTVEATVPESYGSLAIPGTIEAEDYDLGGEGVAYHDTTPGNEGGAYRHDDVDIETANGVTNVGWIRNGEWLAYAVNVTQAGNYTITARVASPNSGRTIAVTLDGAAAATVAVPNTGSFATFANATVPVTLPAGTHVLKLAFAGDGQNIDRISFERAPEPTPTSAPYVNVTIPGTIQAENYDLGGEGVAYHDTTAGNAGGAYRADDVDVATIPNGSAVVGIEDGEYLTYTIGEISSTPELPALVLYLGSDRDGGNVEIEVNGRVAGNVSVPNTGGPTAFTAVQTQVQAAKGTLRLRFHGNGMGMDRIESPVFVSWADAYAEPNFTADRTNGTAPLAVRFTDMSSEWAYAWAWDFGDGATSTEQDPVHTFLSPGVYNVSLTIRESGRWMGGTILNIWNDPSHRKVVQVTVEGSGPAAHAIPGRIEAEDYDVGGFFDTTPGNEGGAYRHDDVDVETGNGITNVGWIRDGEWLAYTVGVPVSGKYTVTASVASPNSGRTIVLLLDGTPIASIPVPNTDSFERYATVTTPLPVSLPSGVHTLKLAFQGDGQNIDWFAIGCNCPTPPTSPVPAEAASLTAAPLSAPKGSAVRFAVTPASGKTIRSAWWSFDAPAHLNTWNSRATNPTFFYPAAGTFSPLVKIAYTDGTTETVQRANYVRVT